MPSFDIVSKLDMGEMKNVVNMAQKEIRSRYDFKGSKANIEITGEALSVTAEDEVKMKAVLDVFMGKMAKRNLGMKSLDIGKIAPSGNQMFKQTITLKQGIDKEQGKIINAFAKSAGKKIQSSYLDQKIRVTGKKIDDLQDFWQKLLSNKDVVLDLQMENMQNRK
jgi:cyclic-di-GMP-binding protein